MGQEQSSGEIVDNAVEIVERCRPCGDWGNKDYNTVKVDAAALEAKGKENTANGENLKANVKWSKEEDEREKKNQQVRYLEAQMEKTRKEEEQRREMERHVKEEQERQMAEDLHRREALGRQIVLDQQENEREQQRQEQERQEHLQEEAELAWNSLQEEAEQRKIKELEDQKKVQKFLKSNGLKGLNDSVRKKFTKTTPLHIAVGQNNPEAIEIVKLLLAAGADPKITNGKNETPLKFAQKSERTFSNAAIIELLQ